MVSSSILRGAIVLVTLATTAGLTARGAMVLLAASLLPLDPRGLGEVDTPASLPSHRRGADWIELTRLFRAPVEPSAPHVAPCETGSRLIAVVSVEGDPARSMARVDLRHVRSTVEVGDIVDEGWAVTHIGPNEVAMSRGDEACRLALFDATPPSMPPKVLDYPMPCAGFFDPVDPGAP